MAISSLRLHDSSCSSGRFTGEGERGSEGWEGERE